MPSKPSIDISISTSAPVLDLASRDPFIIELTLELHYKHPITFRNGDSNLFGGKILYNGGLSFTDTTTRKPAPRGDIDICNLVETEARLTANTLSSFTTLQPKQPYTITAIMEPMKVDANSAWIFHGVAPKKDEPEEWIWPTAEGLEDDKEYGIGVAEPYLAERCSEGSKEDILAKVNAMKEHKIKHLERVPYKVVKPASFCVKRPE